MEEMKLKKNLLIAGALFFGLILFIWFENNVIVTTKYVLGFKKLPNQFNGINIVQISDLHSKKFGFGNRNLIKKIKELKPDMIFITGDIVDYKKYKLKSMIQFLDGIKDICPVYFVNGNHEWKSGKVGEINYEAGKRITSANNNKIVIKKGVSEICISGIDVPMWSSAGDEYIKDFEMVKDERFTILLAHRPDYFREYAACGFDLVFSGHAHGGQVRLPFIGGLFAPNQGFFPKYTSGVYEKDRTKMVVSRGLGNSVIPLRLFNRPEIVEVELKTNE